MSIIAGQQELQDFAGRVTPDLASIITMRHAAVAPFVAATLNVGSVERATNRKVEWATGSLVANTTAIDGSGNNASTTSLTVDDALVFVGSDILRAEATGELMYVSSVDSATTITVVRGFGSTSAAAASVADNAVLRKVAHAAGEGSGIPDARANSTDVLATFVQHFKTPVDLSGISMRVDTLAPQDELAKRRRDAFEVHLRDINHAMTLGVAQASQVDAAGRIVGTMGGIIPGSTVNGTPIGGTMTLAEFEDAVEPVLIKSGGEADLIGGARVIRAINDLFVGKLQVRPADGTFGLMVRSVMTAHGQINIIPDYTTFSGALAGDAFVTPIRDLTIKATRRNDGQAGSAPEAGQPGSGNNELMLPHLRENLQNNDEDARKDAWESELALVGYDPDALTTITGVTGAA